MRAFDTAFALFLSAILLVELFEESDRERSREPIRLERFQLAAAVQIAAVIVLGPWRGALVAALGAAAGSLVRNARFRAVLFDVGAAAAAACAAGLALELAGGTVGPPRPLRHLVPVRALP